MPASLAESGFVPPELNTNEKAASLLENVPELPKGLVRVTMLLLTEQPLEVDAGVDAVVTVHTIFYKGTLVGNVTLILELLGIECFGLIVTVYVVKVDTVESAATTVRDSIAPTESMEAVIGNPVVI